MLEVLATEEGFCACPATSRSRPPARCPQATRARGASRCLGGRVLPASAAAAGNVFVSGSTLNVNAGPGELNDIVIQKHAGGFRVTDGASTLTPGAS
jgi:hypothetical protein